jgi:hypothetical protein
MMKQLARLKFSTFGLRVPANWQQPAGDALQQYNNAFKPEEKATSPATAAPPLFIPASMNKYHTDVQKMLTAKYGEFIDGMCEAICFAWQQWQTTATMSGIIINAVIAAGGQIMGPPLAPLILSHPQAPMKTPMQMKHTNALANVISTSWLSYTATIKLPGLPLFPAFAAFPGPMAPPMPSVPTPFAALVQVPVSVSMQMMKPQAIAMFADPTAPYHKELFESVLDAFEKCFQIWQTSTMVTNIMGTGPIPTFAPPVAPAGPVVMGTGNMLPGGLV